MLGNIIRHATHAAMPNCNYFQIPAQCFSACTKLPTPHNDDRDNGMEMAMTVVVVLRLFKEILAINTFGVWWVANTP